MKLGRSLVARGRNEAEIPQVEILKAQQCFGGAGGRQGAREVANRDLDGAGKGVGAKREAFTQLGLAGMSGGLSRGRRRAQRAPGFAAKGPFELEGIAVGVLGAGANPGLRAGLLAAAKFGELKRVQARRAIQDSLQANAGISRLLGEGAAVE